jgi:hypothetical protein
MAIPKPLKMRRTLIPMLVMYLSERLTSSTLSNTSIGVGILVKRM